jgi:alkylated DNA repair dioxygenase AlkB
MDLANCEGTRVETGKADVDAMIDTERYPIDRLEHPAMQRAIAAARAGLAKDGCARIPGFLRAEYRDLIADETAALAPQALHSSEAYTPYGTGPDDSYPEGHPRRRAHRTTSGSVTRDLIPAESAIQRIYTDPRMRAFVAACLGADEVYEFADPMRGLIVNVMEEGNVLGWHYDANEFIVSLMTRRADAGGVFEYCPDLRAPGDENYDAVREVLDGTSDKVKRLDLQVGDLQLFKGRYSLHRVNRIEKGSRHTVIFGYAREPGFIGSVASTKRVYGRVMQEHLDAEHRRHSDGLAD